MYSSKTEELFKKAIAVNTIKIINHGLGHNYKLPPTTDDWIDLIFGYLKFMINKAEKWKQLIEINYPKTNDDNYTVSFFIALFITINFDLDDEKTHDVLYDFYDMPEEKITRIQAETLMASKLLQDAVKQDPSYSTLFEGYILEN